MFTCQLCVRLIQQKTFESNLHKCFPHERNYALGIYLAIVCIANDALRCDVLLE